MNQTAMTLWGDLAAQELKLDEAALSFARLWLATADNELDADARPFCINGERVQVQIVRCDDDGRPVTE